MFDPRSDAYAHRGLWDDQRPENSLAAFQAAVEAGVGIELDVRLSADGVAMVFHDPVLERMSDGSGLLQAQPAEALSRLRLKGGGRIPTLDAALKVIGGRTPVLVELKADPGRAEGLVDAVNRDLRGYSGAAALMSFDDEAVLAARRGPDDRPVGLLVDAQGVRAPDHFDERAAFAAAAGCNFLGLHKSWRDRITPDPPCLVWTITSTDELASLSSGEGRLAAPIFEHVSPEEVRESAA